MAPDRLELVPLKKPLPHVVLNQQFYMRLSHEFRGFGLNRQGEGSVDLPVTCSLLFGVGNELIDPERGETLALLRSPKKGRMGLVNRIWMWGRVL